MEEAVDDIIQFFTQMISDMESLMHVNLKHQEQAHFCKTDAKKLVATKLSKYNDKK